MMLAFYGQCECGKCSMIMHEDTGNVLGAGNCTLLLDAVRSLGTILFSS